MKAMTSALTPLAAVAALNLAAAMSPGPAFVLITRTAAASSRSSALEAAAGTVAASVLWAAAAPLLVFGVKPVWNGAQA
jgi:threonine/homoserine/homoserine lactone efflux protein